MPAFSSDGSVDLCLTSFPHGITVRNPNVTCGTEAVKAKIEHRSNLLSGLYHLRLYYLCASSGQPSPC